MLLHAEAEVDDITVADDVTRAEHAILGAEGKRITHKKAVL
jgi:hypothetical protein